MRDWQFNFDFKSNYGKPKQGEKLKSFIEAEPLNPDPATFENALAMAHSIDIGKDYFAFLSGKFIFGDLIEALCLEHELQPDCVWLTTLGCSENNIDSIVNLVELGAKQVNLIVSRYFAGVERHKMIPYMEQEFTGKPINVACASIHAKIGIIESNKVTMMFHGSANLSSSDSIEQLQILHNKKIVEYNKKVLQRIFDKWTIFKGNSGEKAFESRNKSSNDLYSEIKTLGGNENGE